MPIRLGTSQEDIQRIPPAPSVIPDNDPDLAGHLADLGSSHAGRFERLGEIDDLEKAIQYQSRALDLTPDDHPSLAGRIADLGTLFSDRFERLGAIDDLEKAIQYQSRALDLTLDDHPSLAGRIADLGTLFSDRFERLGEIDDLEKAIQYQSRALGLTPNDHPSLAIILANLGSTHVNRFRRLGELNDLEQSIKYKMRALILTPDGHPYLPRHLANLGVSHAIRFQGLGELDDLDKAIDYQSRALLLTPEGHPDQSHYLELLGAHHYNRFQRLDDLNDLQNAVQYQTQAAELTPGDHPNFPTRLADLGASYSRRFQRLSDLNDLEKAVQYQTRAVALTPTGHPNLPTRLADLGASYSRRFQRLSELNDLEKAIQYQTRAVALTPTGHPNLPTRLDDLGASYSRRFQRLSELNDLEKAIELQTRALTLTPAYHSDLLSRLTTLGISHLQRFQLLTKPNDLIKSNEYQRRALSLTIDNQSNPPTASINSNDSLTPTANHIRDSKDSQNDETESSRKNLVTTVSGIINTVEMGVNSDHIEGGLPNETLTTNNDETEESVLKDVPISGHMTAEEVISHLVAHGCQDLTNKLDQTTFGEYPISHGGFSDVYRGSLLNNKRVAIKILRISMSILTENLKHLKHAARELHIWGKCNHPNVLQLHGLAVFRGRIGMVSPWMERGSLHWYLEKAPEVDRCNLCTRICEGLAHMHQIGIIHGDLKGANVLISDDGSPVLTDFGNSLYSDQSMKFTATESSNAITVRWAAAELITGSAAQSEASDVYALAMTIYEILAGVLPYDGKREQTIIYLVVTKQQPPDRPDGIPPGSKMGEKLWSMLLRCWSFEPKARPRASEVADVMKTITSDGLSAVDAPWELPNW